MAVEQDRRIEVALNVTRTRVTVLVFNLSVIAFMFSMLKASSASAGHIATLHLTSSTALFAGFCLTLLGLFLLLLSQNLDTEGLSSPFSYTLGSITTYLALSQTVTAFMHEYLVAAESRVAVSRPDVAESARSLGRADALGDAALMILLVMGGSIWFLITYVGPLTASLRSPAGGKRQWAFAGYYFALQIPIYWVYARAWHAQYVQVDHPSNMLRLFALQLAQPLLWFR